MILLKEYKNSKKLQRSHIIILPNTMSLHILMNLKLLLKLMSLP